MKKIKRTVLALAICFALAAGSAGTVFAGEITINFGENVSGVCVHAKRVGDRVDGEFVFDQPFSAAGIDAKNLQTAEAMKKAAQKLSEIPGDTVDILVTGEDTCTFSDLAAGVYLVTVDATETYGEVDPFLIALPTYVDGAMRYRVTSEVKAKKQSQPKTGDMVPIERYLAASVCAVVLGRTIQKRKN